MSSIVIEERPSFGLAIAMEFSVVDRVFCIADKVIGNKPAKQRYRRLFRKEIQPKCCSRNRGKWTEQEVHIHGVF